MTTVLTVLTVLERPIRVRGARKSSSPVKRLPKHPARLKSQSSGPGNPRDPRGACAPTTGTRA